eukprot:scaffold43780_cov46-Prasinocladus_malaysianus.AAC.1
MLARGRHLAGLRGATLIVLILLTFAINVQHAESKAPMVGGGGFARYFRGRANTADIAAARIDLPAPEVTIEFW